MVKECILSYLKSTRVVEICFIGRVLAIRINMQLPLKRPSSGNIVKLGARPAQDQAGDKSQPADPPLLEHLQGVLLLHWTLLLIVQIDFLLLQCSVVRD